MDILNNWSNVTLSQYNEIRDIEINPDTSYFTKSLETLIVLSDSDEWDEESISTVFSKIRELDFLHTKPSSKIKNDLFGMGLKPFSKFSLNEWIDLDKSIADKKFENIIALAYRKTRQDEWGNIIYEPYLFKLSERSEMFFNEKINDVFGVIESGIIYREKVLEAYSDIFGSAEDVDFVESDEDKKYLTEEEIEALKKQTKSDNEKRKYLWENFIDSVSGGNWAYTEKILELPATFVFNMLRMKDKFKD